jgi:hypothetical protein
LSRRAISIAFIPHQARARYASCVRGLAHARCRRREIHDSATMNLRHSGQYFFKSPPTPAWSDLAQRRSLGNLRNEFLIAQRLLIDCLAITITVTQAAPSSINFRQALYAWLAEFPN